MTSPDREYGGYAVLSLVGVDDITLSGGREAAGCLGGAGSYAAAGVALATADQPVRIVSGVGADFPASHADWFGAWSIDTTALTTRGPRTVRSSLVYRAGEERAETPLVTEAEFTAMLPGPADLPASTPALAGVYVLRDADPGFWSAMQAALPARTRVLWEILGSAADAAQWPAVAAVLPRVEIFSVNLTEAARLCGSTDPVTCASRLLGAGARQVSLRMGARGALHATTAQWLAVGPAPGRPARDPTGAGNAHGGALLAAWTESGDLRAAATMAAAAASLVIEQHGPPAWTPCIRAGAAARAAAAPVTDLLAPVAG